ncbi:MAG: hypothetical protein M3Q30_16640 [Actinomycetota bacterium]|nr:hypothetical protein [Actinomycetota bacterium]
MRRWVAIRFAAVAAAAIVLVGLTAAPAAAHTISGPRPTNYRSRVVAIAPRVPGISARIVDLGSKIELTNRSSTEVTVLGYEGEPYLRIGPSGVFENLHSRATYINRTRLGGTVPAGIDTTPTADPQWKKVSGSHTARWHDHNIHWTSPQPPPPVAQSPGSFHHLSQRNIVLLRNGERVAIAVSLDWVPGPSGLRWIPALVALFAAGVLGAASPRWSRALAVLLCLLVLSDIAHAIGFEIPRPGGNLTKLVQFLGGSFVSIAIWIAAAPTVIALLRRRAEALYGVIFVALLVALIGGATDLSALWKSQLPDAGPAWLMRVEVVVALGLGAGIVVGALARMLRSRAVASDDGRGQWLSLLVSGLSDAELARIVRELDADEVLEVALRELAIRAGPVADAFANGAVAFVVTDQDVPVAWSVARSDDASAGLRAARGRVEPTAAEIRASFAVALQLLAGTVLLDDAVARSLIVTTGDAAFVARLAPYLPETATVTRVVEDPASAS